MTGPVRSATRLATPEDLEALFALAQACPGAAGWSRATWAQTLASANPSATQPSSAEPSSEARVVLVIASGQILVGFGVLHAIADEGEIENLGVSPAFRRFGTGRALSEGLLRWARQKGLRRVHLEVRASNLAAQRLYETLGFRREGLRRGYYPDPEEDAVLMGLAASE